MFAKDDDINIYNMSCEKGKFPYSLFIVLTQRHEFPASKLRKFYYLSPFARDIIFKESLFAGSPEQWGVGQRGRLPPILQSFMTMCPFFEEPFKFSFFENIKFETVNIQ